MARLQLSSLILLLSQCWFVVSQRKQFHEENRRLLAGIQPGEETDRIKNGDLSKLGSALGALVIEMEKQNDTSLSLLSVSADTTGSAGVTNERMLVEVIGTTKQGLWTSLESIGVNVVNCVGFMCSAYCSVDQLPKIASLEIVNFVTPDTAFMNADPVDSEGDAAIKADIARATYHVNGTGIKVGVISDSYNCLRGASMDIASGALPANVEIVKDLSYPSECVYFGGTDEGRALIEIVHAVAPGAIAAFRTGRRGAADMVAAIIDLISAGCNVIVSDIMYMTEPFFQDSIIAQHASMSVTRFGIPYFAAAGNFRQRAWQAPNGFQNSGIASSVAGAFHQFGVDSNGQPIIYQNVTFPSYGSFPIYFQWDEPFWSVSGVGSSSDLDIFFLFNNTVVFKSENNNTGKNPFESLTVNPSAINSTGSDLITLRMVITLKSGSPPKYMRVLASQGGTFQLINTSSPVIFGAANAANVSAVGAANVFRTPEYGVSPPQIRSYSSPGGSPIVFDSNGNRFDTPEIRQQPLITGPDGVQTSFFGYIKPGGIWRFPGTSAAAPHIAAAAALLLQFNSTLTPGQVYSVLEQSAVNMLKPGFDYFSGYGFADIEAAFQMLS